MAARRVALLLLVLLPCVAVCQEIPWQAERVMLRRDGVRAGKPVAGHLVRQGKELSADSVYTVLRADGGLLELGDDCGWVARADVVRMAEASAFYTARIKEEPTAAKWYGRRAMARSLDAVWIDVTSSPGRPRVVTGRPSEQLDDLRTAVRVAPSDVRLRQTLAVVHLALGDSDRAAKECEIIMDLAPRDASSHSIRAIVRLALNDASGAVADAERAVELDPMSFGTHNGLALVYLHAGQKTKGEAQYRRVAEMSVNSSSDLYQRAVARAANGDFDGMLADLNEAVRLDPANIEAIRNRGCLLRRRGEYHAALVDFRRAARLQPSDPLSMRMEAFLLATCKENAVRDGKRAIELSGKAVRLISGTPDPGDFEALAAAYAEVGDYPAAVIAQKQAIQALEGATSYYDEIGGLQWWLMQYQREQPRRE